MAYKPAPPGVYPIQTKPKPPPRPKNPYGLPPNYGSGLAAAAANHQAAATSWGNGYAGAYAPPTYQAPSFDPNMWKSDPGYLMALAQQQQGITQLNAWLKQARTSSLIDFGDPTLAIPGFKLDPQTAALIKQNYASGNSQLSRLDKNHELGLKGVVNQLAGRGLLFSGDLGYQQGQQNQLYGNNVYDARNALLHQLNDNQMSYQQQVGQLQSAVAQAAQQAYANSVAQMMNSGY